MLIRRLCSVLIQLAAAVCSSARAQDVPKGEAAFTEYVAAQLRRELKGAHVEVKGPLTLVVGGGLEANLGRIFTTAATTRTAAGEKFQRTWGLRRSTVGTFHRSSESQETPSVL